MDIRAISRFLVLLSLNHIVYTQDAYVVQDVNLQALKPKGLRVFLPDDPAITLFLFEGEIYSDKDVKVGDVWGFGQKFYSGLIFEDHNITLEVGQSIRYHVFVSRGQPFINKPDKQGKTNITLHGNTYIDNNGMATKVFIIKELEDPKAHGPHCPHTETILQSGQACAGQVLFEDNFDEFRSDLWQIEHYIPLDHPDHPFVSYQRLNSNPTVFVRDGNLHIVPKLQQDLFNGTGRSILTSTLDLTSGCTHHVCTMQAVGTDILPPVVSGRVTSNHFAFTYGKIYVRAKLPQGDWLYPEIHLEPLAEKYGKLNYASGVLKVAVARGNKDVIVERYGNKNLYGGPYINAKCREALEFYHKTIEEGYWGDDFHEFYLEWTPEAIELHVDGISFGRYSPGISGLKAWLPSTCRGPWYELLKMGGKMAPFDDHFFITLGVAAGGIAEFPDGLTLGSGDKKPWRNRGRKSALSFWQNHSSWYPSWKQPGLIVDYVKVVAL